MASKATRARKHVEKMKKRRAEKAAKRAKYAALKGTSKKTKVSTRMAAKSRVSGTHKHAHIMANCGNPGCSRCHAMLVGKGKYMGS
jgi:nicotinic acid phosphoribosyltransferase